MRACKTLPGLTLPGLLLAGAALAQPAPAGDMPMPAVPGQMLRPTPTAPPPPGRGNCTLALPCRSALNESFYYTPSGDRQYLTRR